MKSKIIKTLANAEYGIEAVVAEIPNGFSVALRDTDADEYVDMVYIYSTEAAAITKAESLVA